MHNIYLLAVLLLSVSKRGLHSHARCRIPASTGKQPRCPLADEWIKRHLANICNGMLFSHNSEGNPAICDNVDKC